MSALELFRLRVEQSAKAAAGAARQLSSLDDMAQNDEYVQSEGLRLSEKKEYPSSASSLSANSEISSVVEDLSDVFVDALSGAARKHTRPARSQNGNSRHPHNPPPAKQKSSGGVVDSQNRESKDHSAAQRPNPVAQKTDFVPAVAALYNKPDNNRSGNDKSAPQGKIQRQSSGQKKAGRNGQARDKGGKSTAPKADLSLETIPSSPVGGHKTNVLLVNDKHAHILHELDYDSDSSSDDESRTQSEMEIGPLVNVALHDQLEQELEESIERQNSRDGARAGDGEKDVNRFMTMTANWETERERDEREREERERESLLRPPLESVPESTPSNFDAMRGAGVNGSWNQGRNTAGEETSKALRAGLSWVRNVASPQLEAISKQIMTKVSEAEATRSRPAEQQLPQHRPAIGPRHPPRTAKDNEPEITMTTSSVFLADDDMAELERIRMRNSPSKIRMMIQSCINNPRLAFIVVTLIAAVFAYFYSRHRSVDDVL